MSDGSAGASVSPFKQPKAVFAVAFACVVSFMGIGLVDPILPAISDELNATPSQVTLLFTSYLVVTAVAMLITGWVSSRIGAKRTLLAGLALIVVFSALAGASPSIGGIIGFRAGWGIGNALFIATSLAVIIASASGGFVGAIILYETALGAGIAVGPLLGGLLGNVSWRGPFFGVAVLMAIAMIATAVLVRPMPLPERKTGLSEPLRALRHRGLLTMSLTALCYNWAFFTVLGYAPFPMGLDAIPLGFVFTGWGILVALFAVFGAPWLQRRFGIARTLYANLALFAVTVLVIAIWTTHPPVLIAAVIFAGIFIGVNNTVTTQAVMTVSSVERPIASAAYGFVRFIGGGLAPFAAGKLVEHTNVHVPFYIGAGSLVLGIVILSTAHGHLAHAERVQAEAAGAGAAEASDDAAVRVQRVLVTVNGDGTAGNDTGSSAAEAQAGETGTAPIVAAIDDSPAAERVTAEAARIATLSGAPVHLLHAREGAVAGEGAADGESLDIARAVVLEHLERLAASDVPAVGHVLLGATDHGTAGRMVAEHAEQLGARLIVIGAPTHGGIAALMDASAGRELARHARSHILIVNPSPADAEVSAEVSAGLGDTAA